MHSFRYKSFGLSKTKNVLLRGHESTTTLRSKIEYARSIPVRQANPLSLGVWHFTLRFILPGVGLATPGRKAVMQSPTGPKIYPNTLSREEEEEEEEEEFTQNRTCVRRDS